MRLDKWILFAAIVVTMQLAGCASPPHRTLSQNAPKYAMLPNGMDPLNPQKPSPMFTAAQGTEPNLVRQLERKQGRPLNILSLSGGGQNGAFGAGLLNGWREAGNRPKFDIVGGVSTGALLSTHALLGTPEDDATLEEMYTKIAQKDIHKQRGIFSLAFGADSLSDTSPLRELIAKYINADTLKRVAAAYDEGRYLAVGTTNIDYGQTWVWNMSLIAKDGNLELYRQVLLASASFPIVFPPVEIDGHLFVDGAARSNVVIAGMGGNQRPTPPPYGAGNIYLVDNGRLHSPPEALRRALGDVAATTVSVMMDQSMLTAMTRSYFGAKFLGYNFRLAAIPNEVDIGNDPLAFDPKQMRAAFDSGRAMAKKPDHWMTTPPNTGDIPAWALEQFK